MLLRSPPSGLKQPPPGAVSLGCQWLTDQLSSGNWLLALESRFPPTSATFSGATYIQCLVCEGHKADIFSALKLEWPFRLVPRLPTGPTEASAAACQFRFSQKKPNPSSLASTGATAKGPPQETHLHANPRKLNLQHVTFLLTGRRV